MSDKNLDFSYFNSNGKKVSGSAAFNHEVYTIQGGIKNYNVTVGKASIVAFVKENSNYINADIEATSKRKKLKIV